MPLPPPAASGMALAEVDTPALLIDLDAFERNLRAHGRLRAHAPACACARTAKTHKSPDHRRQAGGARRGRGVLPEGVGGRGDGRRRHRRRARHPTRWRARRSSTGWPRWRDVPGSACASTMPSSVAELEVAAAKAGSEPRRDGGDRRRRPALRRDAGRAGGAPRANGSRARRTCALPACRPITARPSTCARRASAARAHRPRGRAREGDAKCLEGGGPARLPSSPAPAPAPTRTRRRARVYNELQAGSYIFMDADYARNKRGDGAAFDTFEHALFVYATVMSAPTPERRHRRCRAQGALPSTAACRCPGSCPAPSTTAPPTSTASSMSSACDRAPGARRQGAARPRPLRSDRQPARLVRRACAGSTAARRAWSVCGRWRRAALCSDFVRGRGVNSINMAIVKLSSPPDMLARHAPREGPHDAEERQLITGLFERMRNHGAPEKDREAEALINR